MVTLAHAFRPKTALLALVALLGWDGRSAAAAPTPAPPQSVASPAAKPLQEIGRVRARSPFCTQAIGHADAAISTALENDARIALTISNLKTVDLDSSMVKKSNGTAEMLKQYTALRASATYGEGQIKLLRTDAAAATDPDEKAELKEFADALGGALERQKKMAEELSRTIAYVDAHATIDDNTKAQFLFDIQWAQTAYGSPFHGDPRDWVPASLSDVAKSAAVRLTEQQTSVATDEGTAAGHVDPAFKTCL
jgi:hypothetical protein